MRRVPSGSFARLSSAESLWRAWQACRRGKRRHPNIAAFDLDADRHVLRLQRELQGGCYTPGPWRLRLVYDPKPRLIAAPEVRDRIVHRALLDEIGPTFERGFIEHSYTGASGRGPHRAVLQYLGWLRRYEFRLHLDIRKYFQSIHLPTLEGLVFAALKDTRTRDLIKALLKAGQRVYQSRLAGELPGFDPLRHPADRGIPLGSYLSQWTGTFYLNGLDHFVKRQLKVPGYLRYMDDFVLFGDSKTALLQARTEISRWLATERRLNLNTKRMSVEPNTASGVFLGYRVSRAGITPSKKLRRRFGIRLRLMAERGHGPLVRCIRSYRGLLLF